MHHAVDEAGLDSMFYELRSDMKGLSHALKTVRRTVFTPVCGLVPLLQVPHIKNKRDIHLDVSFILVGEAGLEPARPQ